MKRILLSLLMALSLLIPASVDSKSFPFLGSIRPLQMQSESGELRNICTASSINEKKDYWITAAHCVADGGQRYIEGTGVFTTEMDEALDLAVLTAPAMDVKAIKLAGRQPSIGDKAYIAGHPFGYPSLFLTQGHVAVVDGDLEDGRHFMVLDVAIAPGNSGSPVLNSKGEMMSILQVGWGGYSPVGGGSTWSNLVRFAGKYFRAR